LYGGYKLFLSKDSFEVMGVDYGISPFRIDILLFSKSIYFGAKTTRMEPNDKVKLREVFRLSCLPLD